MPAYIIGEIAVTDPAAYEPYRALAPATVDAYGGRYLVRGGGVESLEGAPVTGRMVVLEFPDWASAQAWYRSAEYQAVMPLRIASADARVFLVAGAEPQ